MDTEEECFSGDEIDQFNCPKHLLIYTNYCTTTQQLLCQECMIKCSLKVQNIISIEKALNNISQQNKQQLQKVQKIIKNYSRNTLFYINIFLQLFESIQSFYIFIPTIFFGSLVFYNQIFIKLNVKTQLSQSSTGRPLLETQGILFVGLLFWRNSNLMVSTFPSLNMGAGHRSSRLTIEVPCPSTEPCHTQVLGGQQWFGDGVE